MDKKWLAACATAGELLYGQYDVPTLKKMYERKKGCTVSTDDLISAMIELEESGEVLMSYMQGRLEDSSDDTGFFLPVECEGTPLEPVMMKLAEEGNPYASLHLDDDERINLLADLPEKLEFYIPTEKEILQLVEEGYIRTPAMTALEEQIRIAGGNPECLKSLWAQFSTEKLDMMESVNAIMSKIYPDEEDTEGSDQSEIRHYPTLDDLNAMMPYINGFLNNVNLRSRRGWRPDELHKKMFPHGMNSIPAISPGSVEMAKFLKEAEPKLKAMGVNVDYSSLDNYVTVGQYGERRVTKVGRNDLCPCGSGKKYKRCHGR